MREYGEFFPDNPRNLDELVDSLARRAAAAQRLMDSLTPEQRAELAGLMDQAMRDAGLAEEMARLQRSLRAARPDLRLGWPRADERRSTDGLCGRDRRAGRAGRPRRTRRAVVAGLPRGKPRRHRRGDGRARARTIGRRRTRRAAPDRARAAGPGLPATREQGPAADPARDAPARRDRAATRLRSTRLAGPRQPRRSRRGRRRRDHRREPRMAVRRRAAVRRRPHRPQRRAADRGRRSGRQSDPCSSRRLRGRRDRASQLRRGRAAGRHVVLDGAARHVGRGEDDRDGTARAGHDEVPAGRDRDHRVQRLCPRHVAPRH